jgi:hypothetical protein
MFADVPEHMPLTAAASMVALEDIFGEKHPCQEHVLSIDKLNLSFDEHHDVVGHYVDTRQMVVGVTARRQEKIVRFIESKGWLNPKKATIQVIASVYGLLDHASEFFPWARAHLLNLRSLLADCIKRTYAIAKRSIPLQQRLDAAERALPRQLQDRLASMQCSMFAEFAWRNRWRVSINMPSRRGIRIIYGYLSKGLPWEQPIGHVVERDPAFDLTTDSSEEAVGVCVPTIKVICIIPLSDGLWKRATLPEKHPDKLHINALEFVGVIVAFVVLTEWCRGRESQFPPHPVASISCANISAVVWCRKM